MQSPIGSRHLSPSNKSLTLHLPGANKQFPAPGWSYRGTQGIVMIKPEGSKVASFPSICMFTGKPDRPSKL
jgi:hypothetical protein